MIRFFTFEQFHNKSGVGSTRIRVHNLIKHWPEAGIYKYGENPEVMVFQKVYTTEDYKFPELFKGIKILDICDPDWLDGALIKESVDVVDAVACSSPDLVEFIKQLTDKPVVLIRDRFDLTEFPKPKKHSGEAKKLVWFGYHHNTEVLRPAMPVVAEGGYKLTVIADQDMAPWKWAHHEQSKSEKFQKNYKFIPFNQEILHKELQKADICILPKGYRPQDRFKSENKTIIANLCGLPVATSPDDLDALNDPKARQEASDVAYQTAVKDYDVKLSVAEYKDLIARLKK